MSDNCPKRRFHRCEFVLRTLKARPPETVADILADQRAPREMRGKRMAYVCRYCGREEKQCR